LKEHVNAAHPTNLLVGSAFSFNYLKAPVTMLLFFDELFTCYFMERDGRYYGAVQLIGTSSEASKYKCKIILQTLSGVEEIRKKFLVRGYSEDFETIFNSRKCFNLDKETVKFFFGDKKPYLRLQLKKVERYV
jgi:hypothetical protein